MDNLYNRYHIKIQAQVSHLPFSSFNGYSNRVEAVHPSYLDYKYYRISHTHKLPRSSEKNMV